MLRPVGVHWAGVRFRDLLAPVIENAGYRVLAVNSAATALGALTAAGPFSAIVTELELPDMDAFALTRTIKQLPGAAAIPIVGIAEIVSPDLIERGRAAGLHDVVGKFDRTGLIATIDQQTGRLGRVA